MVLSSAPTAPPIRPTAPAARPAPRLLAPQPPPTTAVLERIRKSVEQGPREGAYDLRFQAFGTRCRVQWVAPAAAARDLSSQVIEWVAAFEAKYSRYLPGSLISQINASAGRDAIAVDPDAERLLALCDQMHFLTRGVFDPTALPLLKLWDWKSPRAALPSDAEIEAARSRLGWRRVLRSPGRVFLPEPGMGIDLGGMGKEFAVDSVAELLRQAGVTGALVDFGADVRVIGLPADGRPAWHVGLDDPRQPGRCWRGLGVRDAAVATSGDYARRFEIAGRRYGHILDIRTGRPVDNGCLAVSVVAPTCTQAGMLATASFVLGPEEGLRLLEANFGTAGAIITEQTTLTTRQFHAYVAS